jgi:V/A-type H+-transporting ATPase subunit E
MSAEKIIEQIKKDSENEINQIKKEAEKKAKEIISKTKMEAETEAEKIIENGKKNSENIKKILISKANQDSKKEIMNEREKIINECFTKAHHELSILKEPKYSKIVKKLIKNGCNKLGKDCSILISRYSDGKIAEEFGISVSGKIESAGGIIIKSKDGKIILDHTFDGIFRREKDKIRIKVGMLLFS